MKDADNLTEYVRHYLMRVGISVKETEVYITLRNRLANGDAELALQDLAAFAKYYVKLLDPKLEPNAELSVALSRVKRMEATTIYPFLLNVYQDYALQRLHADTFVEVLRILENYLVRRFICGAQARDLNNVFPSLCRQSRQSTDNTDFVSVLQQTLQNRNYPSDARLQDSLPRVRHGRGIILGGKAKLVLETLESSYQHHEPSTFDSLTIQHIMPENPNDEWRHHLGSNWADIHDQYVHTIGNITLIDNHHLYADNMQPTERLEYLSKSYLGLNRYFQTINRWQQDTIEYRAKLLTDQALLCWPYFGTTTQFPVGDRITGTKPNAVIVLGTTRTVKTWNAVLITTLEILAEQHPDRFQKLLSVYPRYIAKNPQGLHKPTQLANGYSVETNLDASRICNFCQRVISTMGLPTDAWEVKI